MAKVTITIEDLDVDEDSGNVSVRIESDPAFPGPAAPEEEQGLTCAQAWGLRFLQSMKGEAEQVHEHEHHEGCGCEHEDSGPGGEGTG